MLDGSLRGGGGGVVGDPIKGVTKSPFAVVDINGRNGLYGFEVAGIVKQMDVDEVEDGLWRKFPTCSQIAFA